LSQSPGKIRSFPEEEIMKVGIDAFTIRDLNLTPFEQIDYAEKNQFEGIHFDDIHKVSKALDAEELKAVKTYADSKGLYSHISIDGCNPHLFDGDVGQLKENISRQIELCAAAGWYELRSIIGHASEEYSDVVEWTKQLPDCRSFLKSLSPVLKSNASRINIENHGDATTFQLVWLVEETGPDIVGINLDTANMLVHAEDPVMAAARVAPYTHLTHAKDGIIFFTPGGYSRQGRPPGQGIVDWEEVTRVLHRCNPDIPLSLEDHKWLFQSKIYDKLWLDLHPDLTPFEFAKIVGHIQSIEEKLKSGDIMKIEDYEKIPYLVQIDERVLSGRDYLKSVLEKNNLHS
jgi:sugar phosphate isomerase/epimerase